MKAIYIYLISVAVIIAILLIGDQNLKLQHSKDDVYHLKNFRLDDTIFIDEAVVYIGRNYFGAQEAILLPTIYTKDEYFSMYVRFSPEFFDTVLKKELKKGYPFYYEPKRDELGWIETIHRKNIKKYAHVNDFPTITKSGYVPVIKEALPFKNPFKK